MQENSACLAPPLTVLSSARTKPLCPGLTGSAVPASRGPPRGLSVSEVCRSVPVNDNDTLRRKRKRKRGSIWPGGSCLECDTATTTTTLPVDPCCTGHCATDVLYGQRKTREQRVKEKETIPSISFDNCAQPSTDLDLLYLFLSPSVWPWQIAATASASCHQFSAVQPFSLQVTASGRASHHSRNNERESNSLSRRAQ